MATTNHRLTSIQRSFRPSSHDLARTVVHGATFTILGVAIRTLITVGSTAILARLLSPADFGLIAMATVITELGALFSNFGFGSILIQRPNISRIQLDTVFWVALGLGAVLTVAVYLLSILASRIFNEATVGDLLKFMCMTFVFEQLTVVPHSVLSRILQFRKEFLVQVGALLCRASTAVVLAWMGFGVWSLAAAGVAASFTRMCLYTLLIGYCPRLRFSSAFLASTWRTSGGYFGNGILFYINTNIDIFLVGRMLGASSLGMYQNARSLTNEIRARIAIPLQQVLFPAFSILQNEKDRFRNGIVRSGRLLSLVVVPIGFGVAAVAEELVPLLYGNQWLAMIPALKIISIGAGIRATTTVANPIFNATNRVGLSFRLFFVGTVITTVSIVISSRWGLLGVAYALLFSTAVAMLFFRIALGLLQLGSKQLWQMLGPSAVSAILMFVTVVSARDFVYGLAGALPMRFAILVAVGVAIYATSVLTMSPAYLGEVLDVMSKLRRRTG